MPVHISFIACKNSLLLFVTILIDCYKNWKDDDIWREKVCCTSGTQDCYYFYGCQFSSVV